MEISGRKLSIDSQSSGTSNDTRSQRSKRLMIKKKLLHQKQPPFIILSGQNDNNQLNNTYSHFQSTSQQPLQNIPKMGANTSFISYTDPSDSDYSAFENQSIIEGFGGGNTTKMDSRVEKLTASLPQQYLNTKMNSVNYSNLQGRASVGGTPSTNVDNKIIFDIDANIQPMSVEQKKIYHPYAEKPSPFEEWIQALLLALQTILEFLIMDVLGNTFYYIGNCILYILLTPTAIFGLSFEYIRSQLSKWKKRKERYPFKRSKSKQSFFERQSHFQKGDLIIVLDLDKTLVYSTLNKPEPNDKDYIQVQSDSQTIYFYKRPYLDQFLREIANLGEVYLFTASTKSYCDPIIDEIDPKGIIKKRFYREDCKQDKNGNHIKPMEIITKNMKKLIIIDDSELTYNKYKQPWTNKIKKDKWLKECVNIFEQVRISNSRDVRSDLPNIIDMHHHYK